MNDTLGEKAKTVVHRGLERLLLATGLFVALCLGDVARADYEAGRIAYERDDYPTALREFQQAAAVGQGDAMFKLGVMHMYGIGVEPSWFRALSWWEQAAELGQPSAMFQLGFTFIREAWPHPEMELARDIESWQEEAAQGEIWPMFQLGRYYAEGWGVPRDYAKARAWWEKAVAEKGFGDALYGLGVLLSTGGHGIAKDESQGRRWYEQAAQGHHPRAMYELGRLLAEGRGGPRDYIQARTWWKQAAEKDEPAAMFHLGGLYAEGLGVQKSEGQASIWWRKAADMGYFPAMVNLGVKYQEDSERFASEPGLLLAYMWLERAASFGDAQAANRRDQLTTKLTPEQLEEARRLASHWWPERNLRPTDRTRSKIP
jgi:TPR repeat protein